MTQKEEKCHRDWLLRLSRTFCWTIPWAHDIKIYRKIHQWTSSQILGLGNNGINRCRMQFNNTPEGIHKHENVWFLIYV